MKIHIKPHSPGIKDTACKDTKGIFLNDNNTGIKNKKRILITPVSKNPKEKKKTLKTDLSHCLTNPKA